MKSKFLLNFFILISVIGLSCTDKPQDPILCDVLIYNGTIYDGSGEKPYLGSVAIQDDKIIYVGENTLFKSDTTIDATGLAISPGFIKSKMTDNIDESVKAVLTSRIPMAKLGTGEDVSNTVAFLSSDAASYITGETIHVNGGMYMG